MTDRGRREFLQAAILGALAGSIARPAGAAEPNAVPPVERPNMHDVPKEWYGNETVGMLIYPGFTALDLFGPHHFFISMMGAKVLLVAKDDRPVETDTKVKIHPSVGFADCPEKLSILFVPGGTTGTLKAAYDEDTRRFVAERGAKADWVTSVCTGSLILGAAGLLEGRKATCHWMVRERLALFGATPVDERVVVDGNRVTGAGVTSGLDFGLSLVKQLRGEEYAKLVQLFSEYDPAPPFDNGSPKKNPPATVKMLADMHDEFDRKVRRLAEEVRPRPKATGETK